MTMMSINDHSGPQIIVKRRKIVMHNINLYSLSNNIQATVSKREKMFLGNLPSRQTGDDRGWEGLKLGT